MGKYEFKRKGLALLLAFATAFSSFPAPIYAEEAVTEGATEDSTEVQEIVIEQVGAPEETQQEQTVESSGKTEGAEQATEKATEKVTEQKEEATEKKFEGVILFDISDGGEVKLTGNFNDIVVRKSSESKKVSFENDSKFTLEVIPDEGFDLSGYAWVSSDGTELDKVASFDNNEVFKKEVTPIDGASTIKVDFVEEPVEESEEVIPEEVNNEEPTEEVATEETSTTEAVEETEAIVPEDPEAVFESEEVTEAVETEALTEAEEVATEVETEAETEVEVETETQEDLNKLYSRADGGNPLNIIVLNGHYIVIDNINCDANAYVDGDILSIVATPKEEGKVIEFFAESNVNLDDVYECDFSKFSADQMVISYDEVENAHTAYIDTTSLESDAYIYVYARDAEEMISVEDLEELYLTRGTISGTVISEKDHIKWGERYAVPKNWVTNEYYDNGTRKYYYGTGRYTLDDDDGTLYYTRVYDGVRADVSTTERRIFCIEPDAGNPANGSGSVTYLTNSTEVNHRALELMAYLLTNTIFMHGSHATYGGIHFTNNPTVLVSMKKLLEDAGAAYYITKSNTAELDKGDGSIDHTSVADRNIRHYGFAIHMAGGYLYHEYKNNGSWSWRASSNWGHENLNNTGKGAIRGIANSLKSVVNGITGDVFQAYFTGTSPDANGMKGGTYQATLSDGVARTPDFAWNTNVVENTWSLSLPADVTIHRSSDGAQLNPANLPINTNVYLQTSNSARGNQTNTFTGTAAMFSEGAAYIRDTGGSTQDTLAVAVLRKNLSVSVKWPPFEEYVYVKKSSGNTSITNGNNMYDLAGATFAFAGTNYSWTTDSNGNSAVLRIPVGNYTLVETGLPNKGYTASPDLPMSVSITGTSHTSPDDPRILPVTDPPIYGVNGVMFKVRPETYATSRTMEGAEYTINYYDSETVGTTPHDTWVVKMLGNETDGYSAKLDAAHLVSGDLTKYGENVIPLGTITIQETKEPTGYRKNPEIYTLSINEGDRSQEVIQGQIPDNWQTVENEPKYGTITIRKVSTDQDRTTDGDAKFEGAVYEVINNNDYTVHTKDAPRVEYNKGEVVTTFTTNAEGVGTCEAIMSESSEGNLASYIVREVTPPEGYHLPSYSGGSDEYTVNFPSDQPDDGSVYAYDLSDDSNYEYVEPPVRGGFHMEKQDLELEFGYCDEKPEVTPDFYEDNTWGANGSQGDATLQGAEFELYNRSESSVVVDGVTYDVDEQIGDTFVTDENSSFETSDDYLPYGTYELIETKPPVGYTSRGRNTSITFSIRDNGEVTDDNGNRIEWLDKKIHDLATDEYSQATDGKYACNDVVRFDIEIQKFLQRSTEESNGSSTILDQYPACGVQFEIRLKSTGRLYATITTDEAGIATTASEDYPHGRLPYGVYTISEVAGEDGYVTAQKFVGYDTDGNPIYEPYGEDVEMPDTSAIKLSLVGYDADGKETISEETITVEGETDFSGDKWLPIEDFEIDGTYSGFTSKDLAAVKPDEEHVQGGTDKRWERLDGKLFRGVWYAGQEAVKNDNTKIDPIVEEFVKLVKRDATTGKVIPLANTKFKIYKSGKLVGPYYNTEDHVWTSDAPNGSTVVELGNQSYSKFWSSDEQAWVTDESGTVVLPMRLRYGIYKIKEVQAPDGYILPSKTAVITTNTNELENRELVEGTAVGSIVSLDVFNDDQADVVNDETGVRFDDTKLFVVSTRNDKSTESVHDFFDAPVKGVYHITKYDEKTAQRIAGAVFEIRADEDIYTGDGEKRYSKGDVVDVITVGKDGTASTKPLYFGHMEGGKYVSTGKFTAQEIIAPEGYDLDTTIHNFEFSYKDDKTELIHIYEDINNTPTEFHLEKFVKSEDGENWSETETQAILDGVTFKIHRIGGAELARYDNGNVSTDMNSGSVVDLTAENGCEITTTNGGKIDIDYIASGLYEIYETKVPNGYVLDKTVRYFNVDKDGRIYECDASGNKVAEGNVVEDRSENCVSYKLTMTWKNIYTRWDFSKVDINGDKEIPGAEMEIHKGGADGPIAKFYDITGTVGTDAKWTSTEEEYRINRLPLDVDDEGNQIATEYTLVETLAADGYVIATPMKFMVTPDGIVHFLKMYDKQLFIHKSDITGVPEIPGAELTITDKETGEEVDSWTSTEEPHPAKGLKEGRIYTLTEKLAPDEWVKAESIDFFVTYVYEPSQDGDTSSEFNPFVASSLVNQDIIMKDKYVEISKKTVTGEDELPGAEITVYVDNDGEHGEVVDTWISGEEPHKITGLVEGGKYILYENTAPAGYVRASEIQFEVTGMLNELPEISEENPDWNDAEKENQFITMVDKVFYLTKSDITTSKEVIGATIEVRDEEGNLIDEWVSDGTEHKIGGTDAEHQLEEGKTYTLTETKRAEVKGGRVGEEKNDEGAYDYEPKSYIRSGVYDEYADITKDPTVTDEKFDHIEDSEGYTEKITFTVTGADDEGLKVDQKIEMKDDYTKVKISKKDITNGKYVKGAKLTIRDEDGEEVDTWVTTDEDHFIERLPIGTYTLTEVIERGSDAWRDGYTTAETIEFKVTETGIEQKVEMWDDITTTKITKSDITDGKPVIGAKLTIRQVNEDGTEQENAYVTSTGQVCEWVTTAEPYYIERLPFGKYTLTETMTPEVSKMGYVTAEKITFEVVDRGSHEGTTNEDAVRTTQELDLNTLERDANGLPIIPDTSKVYIQKCDMKDDFTKLQITKSDIADSKLIDGAELVIKDATGTEVARWITDTKNEPNGHYIERLPIGKYTLTEIMTPAVNKLGYVTAETISFEIKDTPEIQKCDMKDDFTKVQISKQSIVKGEGGKELPGAKLVIKDSKGKVVEEWTSGKKPHYIERLPMGGYTLTEVTAPKGYAIAETVKFTVKDTGKIQKVVMKDKPLSNKSGTPSNAKIAQTGERTIIFVIAGVLVLLAAVALFLLRKKKVK